METARSFTTRSMPRPRPTRRRRTCPLARRRRTEKEPAMTIPVQDLLRIADVEAVYGDSILALRGVSLCVPEGSIVALLGANGSGKTTTLKAVSNLLGASRGAVIKGEIAYRGEPTVRLDPADLVRRGIVQVLEGRHCFPHLTVEENLLSGGFARRPS